MITFFATVGVITCLVFVGLVGLAIYCNFRVSDKQG